MSKNKLKLSLVGIFLIAGCTGKTAKMTFTPLKMLTLFDTTKVSNKTLISKEENYLITNYRESKESLKSIDSFVNKNKDKALLKYSNYYLSVYKESDVTNVENIMKNKRIVDRYSNQHDLLYSYFWREGKFSVRYKYKDGEIIEPVNNIIVKDVN